MNCSLSNFKWKKLLYFFSSEIFDCSSSCIIMSLLLVVRVNSRDTLYMGRKGSTQNNIIWQTKLKVALGLGTHHQRKALQHRNCQSILSHVAIDIWKEWEAKLGNNVLILCGVLSDSLLCSLFLFAHCIHPCIFIWDIVENATEEARSLTHTCIIIYQDETQEKW